MLVSKIERPVVLFPSPLRYPGGKAQLSSYLEQLIEVNGLFGSSYYEPYCGGAGAALSLLESEAVERLFLNDADRRVYSFWRAALTESDRFVDKILTTDLSIPEWHKQREICNRKSSRLFDIGFATFYLNRCNRSGVLSGAGPIGGFQQKGRWKLDARFNREELANRIANLKKHKKRISISCSDAIVFLKRRLPRGRDRKACLVYLDPPYVQKGQRLYLNAYDAKDHWKLGKYLDQQLTLNWIVSYDDCALVREIYSGFKFRRLNIKYSLQSKREGRELLISPQWMRLPYCS